MAGNPYTESGERFQVPDMLSNRADIYNLGDIIGDSADAFEISYLENCLTSNRRIGVFGAAPPEDAQAIIRAAERDSLEGVDLQGKFSMDQVREMFEVCENCSVSATSCCVSTERISTVPHRPMRTAPNLRSSSRAVTAT